MTTPEQPKQRPDSEFVDPFAAFQGLTNFINSGPVQAHLRSGKSLFVSHEQNSPESADGVGITTVGQQTGTGCDRPIQDEFTGMSVGPQTGEGIDRPCETPQTGKNDL